MSKLTKTFLKKVVNRNWSVAFGVEFWLSACVAYLFYTYKPTFLSFFDRLELLTPTMKDFVVLASSFGTFGLTLCPLALIFVSWTVTRNLCETYETQMRQNYYVNHFRLSLTMFVHWFLLTTICACSLFKNVPPTFITQYYKITCSTLVFLFCYALLLTISLLLHMALLGVIVSETKEAEGLAKVKP